MPVARAMELAGITDIAGQKTTKLSGGQAQRVRYALALVPDPDLLVLDEPTVAMDVEVRRAFWASMRTFTASGRTVLFATHYLDEADANAGLQAGNERMSINAAHRLATGRGIRIALVDTGLDSTHPDLHGRIGAQRNFVDNDQQQFQRCQSALECPAYGPQTHRQRGEPAVNWKALAQVGGTIIVLMGVARRAAIADELMDGGLAADTPVAAVQHATATRQQVVRCALSELGEAAVESPATIVIGAVAAFDLTSEFIRGLAVADT
jgi:subtilisin family serine protease